MRRPCKGHATVRVAEALNTMERAKDIVGFALSSRIWRPFEKPEAAGGR